jgi:hypothetical protein
LGVVMSYRTVFVRSFVMIPRLRTTIPWQVYAILREIEWTHRVGIYRITGLSWATESRPRRCHHHPRGAIKSNDARAVNAATLVKR